MTGIPYAPSPLFNYQNSLGAMLGNPLGQYQGNQLSNLLAAQQQAHHLAQLNSPANAAFSEELRAYRDNAHNDWVRGCAKEHTELGEKLIGRIAFWSSFLPFSAPIIRRLARKLDATTAEAERYAAMIRLEQSKTESVGPATA